DTTIGVPLGENDVVVAEEIVGTRGLAESTLAALASAGILALVAGRFAPCIRLAAQAHGIPTLVVDTPSFLRTGDRVRLDLDAAKIVNLSSGDRAAIRNLDDTGRAEVLAILARRPTR